jgi:hypothetical protein
MAKVGQSNECKAVWNCHSEWSPEQWKYLNKNVKNKTGKGSEQTFL